MYQWQLHYLYFMKGYFHIEEYWRILHNSGISLSAFLFWSHCLCHWYSIVWYFVVLPAEIGKAWLEDVHQLHCSTPPLQSPHQAHPATQFAEEWRFISATMKNCNELVMYNIDIWWRKSAYVLCEHTMNDVIQKLIQNNIVEYMMFVEIMIKILKVSSNVHI